MVEKTHKLPRAFFWRRMHSLMGIWLTLYLIEHLLVNSQAALFFGDDGGGFIHAVNSIKTLPYLPVIEIVLLGIPILIHAGFGIEYLRTGKLNSFRTDGSTPSLPQYSRNQAYSWQRVTSWILLIAIAAHVIHMRFIEYPASARVDGQKFYMVRLDKDAGLDTLAARLNVQLFDAQKIAQNGADIQQNPQNPIEIQRTQQQEAFNKALNSRKIKEGQVIAVTDNFGTAELLMVRETFKMPIMILLYTLLVITACYHGFNGLWTFLITWGVTLTARSQQIMRHVSTFLMVLVAFLGLVSIWGTYWINLKY